MDTSILNQGMKAETNKESRLGKRYTHKAIVGEKDKGRQ